MSTSAQPRATGARGRRALPALVVVVVVVVLVSVAGHLLGYRLNLTTASVAPPTAAAGPEEVVRTYVDAYDHRDWATMAAVYPGETFDRHRAIGTMTDLMVVSTRFLHSAEDGNPAEPGVSYAKVRVTLRLHDLTGSDLADDEGPNGWEYLLERRGSDEPWHIADHGNP